MKIVIGTEQCQFELYIINDDQYTDYDIGNKLSGTISDNGYDCFEEDVCEIADEIAKELYTNCNGQFKYIIQVCFEYTKSYDYYYGCNEYDIDYQYNVISREKTDYFNEE